MAEKNTWYWLIGALAAIAVIVFGRPVEAGSAGNDWRSANRIEFSQLGQPLYGRLAGSGDARFYRLKVAKPSTVKVRLDVSPNENGFKPQFVIYRPDAFTFGPLLPMEQPPRTVGLVYPAKTPVPSFSIVTQLPYLTIMDVDVEFKTAGEYYIAVYNASEAGGNFRLRIGYRSYRMSDVLNFPLRWWRDHAFAGPSTDSLIIPLAAGLLAPLSWRAIHHDWSDRRKKKSRRTIRRSTS